MSSAEENAANVPGLHGPTTTAKKRRIQRLQRACDVCRRKKIRCDWAVARGNRCTYCRTHQLECNYTHGAREKKQGAPEEYIQSLEQLVKQMTTWIHRHHPDVNVLKEFNVPPEIERWIEDGHSTIRSSLLGSELSVSAINLGHSEQDDDSDLSDDEASKLYNLQERLENMYIMDRFLGQGSVLGKSSGVSFIKSALELKQEPYHHGRVRPHVIRARRTEFWGPHQWEVEPPQAFEPRLHDFPPTDLMNSLIDLWFDTKQILVPLLHRPTFMQNFSDGLHYREGAFASVVLLVCACAARVSSDTRVLYTDSWVSAGWRWFQQVRTYYKTSLSSPSLHDVQAICLTCLYMEESSMPQACWTMCATGIRLAQDVGAHNRKAYLSTPTVQDELWKRSFWLLVTLDRWLSVQLGRSPSIQDEDFDLDYPIDCDDEHWENPDSDKAFKQPSGKPSRISYFISLLKLNKVLGMAMRTVFSINKKSNILLNIIGPKWEQKIVSALDSSLNEWLEAIPEHLKWDPNCKDAAFVLQSGCLSTYFYEIQIMVHRYYIPTPQKPSPVSFPSLAICTNAARSCCHVMASARQKSQLCRGFLFQTAAFKSALVLIYNIWAARRNGIVLDTMKDVERIRLCMEILKDSEPKWTVSGRFWDVLNELTYSSDLGILDNPSIGSGDQLSSSFSDPGMLSADAHENTHSLESTPHHSFMTETSDGIQASSLSRQIYRDDLFQFPLHSVLPSTPSMNPSTSITPNEVTSTNIPIVPHMHTTLEGNEGSLNNVDPTIPQQSHNPSVDLEHMWAALGMGVPIIAPADAMWSRELIGNSMLGWGSYIPTVLPQQDDQH